VHILDVAQGGEQVAVLQSQKAAVKYTSLDCVEDRSLILATSDCQIVFFEQDPHMPSKFNRT
jgi:hypothetical protein